MNLSILRYYFLPFTFLSLAICCYWFNSHTSSVELIQTTSINKSGKSSISSKSKKISNISEFQSKLIDPVLKKINLYSESASKLLLGTAIQESLLGKISKNIFQIELTTVKDINKNYLVRYPELNSAIKKLYNPRHTLAWNLSNNIKYEIAIARVIYLKSHQQLPEASNISALARYWKKNYNTYLGKGRPSQFVLHFKNFLSENKPVLIQA